MTPKLHRYLLRAEAGEGTDIKVSEKTVRNPSRLHWHNFIEVEMVIGGSGYNMLNGQRFQLSRGSLYLLRLIDFHEVHPEPELKLLHMCLDESLLSEDLLNQLATDKPLTYTVDEEETGIMERLFRLIIDENNSEAPDKRYLKHLLICILLRILKLVPDNSDGYSRFKEKPIRTAILYLHMHFRENPSLKEIAEIVHYNASHFSTTFHKELGTTYCEYLNVLKINYAKELLISTSLKITEICYESGFTSHSNFLRLFKEQVGVSPMQFRKKQNKV